MITIAKGIVQRVGFGDDKRIVTVLNTTWVGVKGWEMRGKIVEGWI